MMKVFDVLTQLGPVVMLPIIITLFGLLFRLSFGKALRPGYHWGRFCRHQYCYWLLLGRNCSGC